MAGENGLIFSGKCAVVTGGSRGIGRAIALKLAALGADVAVIYSGDEAGAADTCSQCSQFGAKTYKYCCNVADFAQVKELAGQIKKDMGTVNILVNNAGVTRDGLIATMKEEDFDKVLDTNLKGAFNMIRHFTSFFIRNKGGAIINISSVSGIMGNAGQANYSASKAGLIGLTKSVARELAPRHVTCNAVAPGFVDTAMTKALDMEEEDITRVIPLGRMAKPEEIADAVAFFAASEYITGEVLKVDGGVAI